MFTYELASISSVRAMASSTNSDIYRIVSFNGASVVISTPACFAKATGDKLPPDFNVFNQALTAGCPSFYFCDMTVPIVKPAE